MFMINGSDNQPCAKAAVFADDVNGISTGAGCVSTRGWLQKINTYLARTWVLSQVQEEANKKQILCAGIVLFIMPISSFMQLAQVRQPLQGRYGDIQTWAQTCSSLLMGKDWLSYADMRSSCHVLEGVINHHRPLKSPQTHFWSLPLKDCTWSTVLHPIMQNSPQQGR